jgi:hypothetical protein
VSSPTQRPVPDNAQHSQETDIHALAGFKPTIPAIRIDASHHAATWIGNEREYYVYFFVFLSLMSLGAASHVHHPGCLNGWWKRLAELCPAVTVNCLLTLVRVIVQWD